MLHSRILCILVLSFITLAAWAYDNDGRDAQGKNLLKGGPHRTINDLSLVRWSTARADPLLKRYLLSTETELLGPTIVDTGMEIVNTGDRTGTFRWWVDEGGFTADEPELYNSFRHFYDPKSNEGAPYLTDHLTELNYVYKALIYTSKIGRAVGIVAGTSVNPEVNARDWAISGEANRGWGANEYCWNRGIEYMTAAFAETNGKNKQRLFAQAWRSLGETMHLMADMTCVPHVRNDSHPGKAIGFKSIGNTDPNQGYLKNDPYELYCTEALIRASANGGVDPAAKGAIDNAKTVQELFDAVATYTQDRFFSADTIAGTYIKHKGTPQQQVVTVKPANGRKPYASPSLGACTFDDKTGYFTSVINGKPVRMCHETWMSSIGWGDPAKNGPQISVECVKDQAAILIPVATYANAKLIDMFMPRVDVQITGVDQQANTLTGAIAHLPGGIYPNKLIYKQGQGQRFKLWLNGAKLDPERYFLEIKNDGEIKGEFEKVQLKEKDTLVLGVDVGGILIKSPEYVIEKMNDNLAKLHTYNNISLNTYLPAVTWTVVGGQWSETRGKWLQFSSCLTHNASALSHIPVKWNGTSFTAEGTLKSQYEDIKHHIKITGAVDAKGTTIVSVACSQDVEYSGKDPYTNETYYAYVKMTLTDVPLTGLKNDAIRGHVSNVAEQYFTPNSGRNTYKLVGVDWNKLKDAQIGITFTRVTKDGKIQY
ncbi:MAG: hypothetical protein ACYDCO_04345 [Armatimonadota bacterium]